MPNETHYGKRRTLQLAERALKRDSKRHLVAREEWMHPSAKGEILVAMRRLQLSLSPNLREHFYDFEGPGPAAAVCSARRKTVAPRCESDPACVWEPARPQGRCVPRVCLSDPLLLWPARLVPTPPGARIGRSRDSVATPRS